MNILYIPSGYSKIYHFFDKCIVRELNKLTDVNAIKIPIPTGLSRLKSESFRFKPNLALTLVGDKLPLEMLQWFKKKNIKTALWLTEDPYFIDRAVKLIPNYDYAFTIDIGAYLYYQKLGYTNVHHLPLGTDPHTFSPKIKKAKYESDLCMIGYPYPSRIKLIEKLLNETSFHITVSGGWHGLITETKHLTILKGWLPPRKVASYYSNAKIVLNTHRAYDEKKNENSLAILNQSVNNRTFDIAACESFQLIDQKDDLGMHFVEGQEIISFKNNEDAVNKILFYLAEEKQRKEIAKKARERVLKSHTFSQRLTTLIRIIHDSD
ncbi:CgeB family protein [Halalkalibacter urbisdiaboli]|uniref:CgeB family protein n=1 Tax=Halalkalibacter urbisdiaboli TaxID=1960589 RepID=UPI000B444196|nr:glycosyltransferase [Halalkalibacter urbisdiaboli]